MPRAILVTGFLGSGKTTFVLRSLVDRYRDRRLALVVNDFGKVSYDRIAYYREGLRVMGVEGGCFCCESAGELAEVLSGLGDVELLVVETSGLSDPYPVMQTLETSGFSSYLTVCLLPADSWRRFEKEPVFLSQLQYSHCVVVSRCDLVLEEELLYVRDYLQKKPHFLCYEGVVEEDFFTFLEAKKPERIEEGHSTTSVRGRFSQTTLRLSGYYSMQAVEEYLRRLPEEIVRVKGYLKVIESPTPTGINWTRSHMSWEPIEKPLETFLTFIAYGHPLLPPFPQPEEPDWSRSIPPCEFDRREGIAYLEGKVVDELSAIEWLMAQNLEKAHLITSRNGQTPPFRTGKQTALEPAFEDFFHILEVLKEDSGTLILWDIPDALAGYLIKKLPERSIIHFAKHHLLPPATLSLRVDTPEKIKAFRLLYQTE